MKIIVVRIVSVILLIAVMAAIFAFSAQPAGASEKASKKVTGGIFRSFFGFRAKSKSQQKKATDKYNPPIRKIAHLTIYFALGFSAFLSIMTYKKPKLWLKSVLSFVFCVLYAASDEIHQYFVAGRSCSYKDVLIDSLGAAIAIAIMTFIFIKTAKKYEERKRNG